MDSKGTVAAALTCQPAKMKERKYWDSKIHNNNNNWLGFANPCRQIYSFEKDGDEHVFPYK